MAEAFWRLERGQGPLVATSIHDGHGARPEVLQHFAMDEATRLREEDPYTSRWVDVAPTRVVALRSRFEVDLNRPRQQAVYRTAADAWGLTVWNGDLPDDVADRSLAEYDAFYAMLEALYGSLQAEFGAFVVFDLHTYNHRRDGPDGPAADPADNPQVNVGTGTLRGREKFAGVIDRFMRDLAGHDFPGGRLDVRENVKFRGGNHAGWAHERFPGACVLAIEFKKFFMDEWTGAPDLIQIEAIRAALAATVPGVLEEIGRVPRHAR